MDKFEIVTGKQVDLTVQKEKHAGVSFYKAEDGLYKIHLNVFPNVTYFMQKNRNNDLFTIFSKRVKNGNEVKLLHPVGQGKILNNLKTHMQLQFEVLNATVFMSLFPKG